MALRWGICGCGRISSSFVGALQVPPSDEHSVVAVAARVQKDAKIFAETFDISKAYEGYEQLAKDPDVDVVYIGVVNSEHLSACELMLNNGKHVLCEKPLGMTRVQAQKIVDLAKEKKLFCMEAIAGRFFPAYSKIRDLIMSGSIGDVKMVVANYGIPLMHQERLSKSELGGGAILDLGIYPIQFATMVYGGKALESVTTKGFLTKSGVDDTSTITLQYSDHSMASLICSASIQLSGEAFVFGTKGQIRVPRLMSRPTKLEVTYTEGETEIMDFPIPPDASDVMQASLRYGADAVNVCIRRDKLESPLMSHEDSLTIATIMDKARHQLCYQLECERENKTMPCQ